MLFIPKHWCLRLFNMAYLGFSLCDDACHHSHTALHWPKLILQQPCWGLSQCWHYCLTNSSSGLLETGVIILLTIEKDCFIKMHSIFFRGSSYHYKDVFPTCFSQSVTHAWGRRSASVQVSVQGFLLFHLIFTVLTPCTPLFFSSNLTV